MELKGDEPWADWDKKKGGDVGVEGRPAGSSRDFVDPASEAVIAPLVSPGVEPASNLDRPECCRGWTQAEWDRWRHSRYWNGSDAEEPSGQ